MGTLAAEPALHEADHRAAFEHLQKKLLAYYGVSATSRYVTLREPAIRLHLLEAGPKDADPLLIVHGGDGEAVDWAPLMAQLQEQMRIYAIDRPGFGLSDPFDYRHVNLRKHAADLLSSVLDALGLEKATLIGGSMGGFFSLVTALDRPERVHKLVLVGFTVGVTSSASIPLRVVCGVPRVARLFMRNAASLDSQRRQYRNMFKIAPDTIPELYFKTRLAGVLIPGAQRTWATLLQRVASLSGFRPEVYLGEELSALEVPTLFIWGAKDDMGPISEGERACARIPDGRFVRLENIGHFPFLEVPSECAKLVTQFLRETHGASGPSISAVR
jgi:pimeloyl-ACP methyl ester carboxylesterase